MSKLRSNDPMLAATQRDSQATAADVGVDLTKNTNELRGQQGLLQRMQTKGEISRSAGDAERKLRRIQHDGQVQIGRTAMDIFVGQTVKTMRAQAAAHDQGLNNRLLVQEVNGGRNLSAISAEGMVRQADDHEANMRTVQTRIHSGAYTPDTGERLQSRMRGLNALTEDAHDHAISSALEDNAAYFQDARKKFRQQDN